MPSEKFFQLRQEGIPDLHNNVLLKACQKDSNLLAELFRENKDFIFSIIARYKGNVENLKATFNVDEEDLLQHAYIGLMTALKDFDFNRGIRFTTFAYRPILWEINQLLYNDSKLVRLGRSAIELMKRMEQVEDELGYFPKPKELSEMLGVPVERIEEVLRFATELTYYDALDHFDPVDISLSYENVITEKIYVESLMKEAELDKFETKVVELIMAGDNNSQIAEKLKVYPMTISRAIERIRNKIIHDYDDRKVSKYDNEIELITEEMEELGCIMNIDDIKDLLDVCGYDISIYTPRILYYIRQKARHPIERELIECAKQLKE